MLNDSKMHVRRVPPRELNRAFADCPRRSHADV